MPDMVRQSLVRDLAFELSRRRRQDARARAVKIHRVPQAGPWWPVVGAPLERGVRPHSLCQEFCLLCRKLGFSNDSAFTQVINFQEFFVHRLRWRFVLDLDVFPDVNDLIGIPSYWCSREVGISTCKAHKLKFCCCVDSETHVALIGANDLNLLSLSDAKFIRVPNCCSFYFCATVATRTFAPAADHISVFTNRDDLIRRSASGNDAGQSQNCAVQCVSL